MEAQKVDMFIMTNSKYFESYQLNGIRERLLSLDESKWVWISTLQLKDPTISLIISILVGHFGVDRMVLEISDWVSLNFLHAADWVFGHLSTGF